MKLAQKVSQWLKPIATFKFLFLLAIFLLSYAFLSQQYLHYQQMAKSDEQSDKLINFIVTSSKQQILPLLKNNRLESVSEVMTQLLDYEQLYRVAIYKADGTLLDKAKKNVANTALLVSKVSKLDFEQENYGYLIYEFEQEPVNTIKQHLWLYYLAAILWFLACALLMLKKKTKSTAKDILVKDTPRLSYKKELQQLLKRSQEQSSPKNLLIINSDWESYNNKPRQPLLSLLNKWTAHHKSHLVSFDKDLLILGLPTNLDSELFKKIQILEICLKQLGINPTLLVHSLEFGEAIYQHFFGIVEQGIWVESNPQLSTDTNAISVKQEIEIEVESFGLIQLKLIDALKAEDAIFIERQSRFFLQ